MADRMGIYFDETINNRLRGVSRAESLEIILEKYEGTPLTAEQKAELMEEKNNTYRELLKTMTAADVTDEVRDTLKKLHKPDLNWQLVLQVRMQNLFWKRSNY